MNKNHLDRQIPHQPPTIFCAKIHQTLPGTLPRLSGRAQQSVQMGGDIAALLVLSC